MTQPIDPSTVLGTREHAEALTKLRFPAVRDALQWLTFAHLPEALQNYSRPFYQTAVELVTTVKDSPELTHALNGLITAKDWAVRAGIRTDTGRAGSVPRPVTISQSATAQRSGGQPNRTELRSPDPGSAAGMTDLPCGYEIDPATGHVSDGHHTFGELYDHRRALTAVLAAAASDVGDSWRSKAHHPEDGPMFEGGYFIVGIELPTGTITYHYKLKHWEDFAAVPEREHAPKWDGATPDDTVTRCLELARLVAEEQ